MTPERLQEIKARCESATGGPWEYLCDTSNRGHILYGDPERDLVYCPSCSRRYGAQFIGTKDGPFVAHARQDLPDCLEEIERMQSLTNTITPVCIYCFKKWKTIPVTDTEAYTAMVPEILEHVSVCEKSPLVQEIERLRGLIERIATDKGGDVWATFSFNPIEEARKVLEQIGTDAGD